MAKKKMKKGDFKLSSDVESLDNDVKTTLKFANGDYDEILSTTTSLIEQINESYADSAFSLSDETPSDVKEWLDTGSTLLNICISNKKDGGIPIGRITSISGPYSSGKSLILAHIIADVQKRGGIAVLIESEFASSSEFMQAVGVDLKSLVYIQLNTVEDVFNVIESIINKIRGEHPDKLLFIGVDSLTALTTKKEEAETFDEQGYGMEKAKLCSRALRKITGIIGKMRVALVFTNQIRMRPVPMKGMDPTFIPGGQAILFYPSVIIRVDKIGQITIPKGGSKEVIGINTMAKIVKNRLNAPFKKCKFPIFFDRGIDDAMSVFSELKDLTLLEKSGKTSFSLSLNKLTKKMPENIQNNYSTEAIKEIVEQIKNKVDIEIEGNGTYKKIIFEKDQWYDMFDVVLFKCFIIDILSEMNKLVYLRRDAERKDISIEEDEEEPVSEEE